MWPADANDKDIVAVIEGPVAVGAESLYAALGDKPVIWCLVNAVDTAEEASSMARQLSGAIRTFARNIARQVRGAHLLGGSA